MSPPELARDAPGPDALHPVEVDSGVARRFEPDPSLFDGVDRGPCELLHPAPPLERDQRLDASLATAAEADRVSVRLLLFEQAVLAEALHDPLLSFVLRQAGELARLLVHAA